VYLKALLNGWTFVYLLGAKVGVTFNQAALLAVVVALVIDSALLLHSKEREAIDFYGDIRAIYCWGCS